LGEPVSVMVSRHIPVVEAFLAMERSEFAPVVVLDDGGHPVGVLTERHLLQVQRAAPVVLQHDLEQASSGEALARTNHRLFEMVGALVRAGCRPAAVARLIARNSDVVLAEALRLAISQLGPPPAAFAFMVLGSSGRLEQTLKTDQDNAIVYEDLPPEREGPAHEYFLALGRMVCDLLAACGYDRCEGGIMAANPSWCQPLSRWKANFARWIATSEAEDLLQAKIFFDFRAAAGEARLVEALRPALAQALAAEPRFFFLLARNVLLFQPPLGLFGNFLFDPTVPDRQVFDLKGVMALIVDFCRIYALKHGLALTNTHERLAALTEAGVLNRSSATEMRQAYDFLLSLRLRSQVNARAAGRPADNWLEPATLTAMEQKMLKEILGQIKDFQVKLSFDFTGSMVQQA
jgi:CBS domain-containing protein